MGQMGVRRGHRLVGHIRDVCSSDEVRQPRQFRLEERGVAAACDDYDSLLRYRSDRRMVGLPSREPAGLEDDPVDGVEGVEAPNGVGVSAGETSSSRLH